MFLRLENLSFVLRPSAEARQGAKSSKKEGAKKR
jgi:hypothetical protein